MLKLQDAKKQIQIEWSALPKDQRTKEHAPAFAMQMADKYPFNCRGDRYTHILGWVGAWLSHDMSSDR